VSNADMRQRLIDRFTRLRERGFKLGMGELLSALRVVEDGRVADDEQLKRVARMLWCHSQSELAAFEQSWETEPPLPVDPPPPYVPPRGPDTKEDTSDKQPTGMGSSLKPPSAPAPELEPKSSQYTSSLQVDALPVWAPLVRSSGSIQADWPIPRRTMAQAWRQLSRRPHAVARDVLDIKATVDQTARQGFFLSPVYTPEQGNDTDLLLLVDRGGSMVPFHRFAHELVATAHEEGHFRRLSALYFHNVPSERAYRDPYVTMPVVLDRVLADCTPETAVLVISDAGAARGHRRLERVRATALFLSRVKQRTSLIAWLNPMPQGRWPGTSAQIIAHMAPMFPMHPDGMFDAINTMRGQVSRRAD
jgi:uncharacterized protein